MTKLESNRINALKSTGPKTRRGKQASRQNALKHGIFSQELLVSESDMPAFEELRSELAAQLKPTSPLQEIGFEAIVSFCWRCKLANRLEAKQYAAQLQRQEESSRTPQSNQQRHVPQWYGTDRLTLRDSIRELKKIEDEFRDSGYFKEETKAYLTDTIGHDFVELLTDWIPMNKDVMMMAYHLVSHAQTFEVTSASGGPTPQNVVSDPQQSCQMVGKLLELRRHFLEEVLRLRDQMSNNGGVEARFEFNPRLLAATNRDLHRAVDWFLHLRSNQL